MYVKILRCALIFWALFIGLGAVFGALCMFIDPSGVSTGMDGLLPGLQKLPLAELLYTDLRFSGAALFIINGLGQLTALGFLLKRSPLGPRLCAGAGVLLMLWICIQFFIFSFNLLSTAYFIFGLLETLEGFLLHRRETV